MTNEGQRPHFSQKTREMGHPTFYLGDILHHKRQMWATRLAIGQIDRKAASLMLYSLQIATSNLQYAALEKSP